MTNAKPASKTAPLITVPILLTMVFSFLGQVSVSARDLIVISNLVSFNGTNGQQPAGPLLIAKDGNIYGTTLYGGTNAAFAGSIFRVSPSGSFSNLAFFNITNGANPNAGVIQGADGNFYGTTTYGGATNDSNNIGFGTVFELTTNGALKLLASFNGTNGKNPNALIEISPGVFCGTANSGGAFTNFAGFGFGTLFKADTNKLLTNLLSFNDINGAGPSAGLTMVTGGTLFGTTTAGGADEFGTAFRLAANGSISSNVIFNFTNGAVPAALVVGRDGNLYGTTTFGGSNQFGTVFKMNTNLALTTLVNFTGTNGNSPTALIQGNDGNFYGLTSLGSRLGFGNFFRLTTNGVVTPLYDFTGGSDGYGGVSLVQGKDGSFYGSTSYGGKGALGNIFKLAIIPAPTIQNFSMSGHSLTLTWPAVSNWTYDVQFITNVIKTNWTKLKSVTASNSTGTVTDAVGVTPRFYRISVSTNGNPGP